MLAESKSPSCLCLPQPEPWEPDSHGGPAKSTLTPATRCWNRHFLLFPKTFGTEIFNLLHSRNRNYGKGGIQTSPKAEAAPTEHTGISQGNFYFLQSLWPQDPSSDNHAELRIKKSHRRVGWVWATSCRYGVSKRATLNHCERNFPNKKRQVSEDTTRPWLWSKGAAAALSDSHTASHTRDLKNTGRGRRLLAL